MISFSNVSKWALGLGVIALLSGCASVSVNQNSVSAVPQMPRQIFVAGFDTAQGVWNVDRQNTDLADFQQNLQAMMSAGIVADIQNKLLVPTSETHDPVSLPAQDAWLITGQFVRVNQGSRALRAIVGFGAGGTKLETVVKVYDLQNGYNVTPFLTFTTEGGSGALPGALESAGPLGAALKAIAGSAKGLTPDTARTARMVTAEISQYMYQSGWIPKDLYIKPKQQD